jgi:hypothetical protein
MMVDRTTKRFPPKLKKAKKTPKPMAAAPAPTKKPALATTPQAAKAAANPLYRPWSEPRSKASS